MEKGQGEPVILIHGTLGDFRSWELQKDISAEKYRTISYSRRYHYLNSVQGEEAYSSQFFILRILLPFYWNWSLSRLIL